MKTATKTPQALRQIIKSVVSKRLAGRDFQVVADPTGFGGYHVLRVITPAWKRMNRMDRILKMEDALMPVIPAAERKKIFHFSVMTPDEWKEFRMDDFRKRKFTVVAKSTHVAASLKSAKALSAKRKIKPATS